MMAREMDIDQSQHDFQFTRRWFKNRNLPTFREHIHPHWAGKEILYLELGVFEGMSMVWMLQHILTHEKSKAVGVDPWLMTRKMDEIQMSKVMDRAGSNLYPWIEKGKCSLVRGNSAEVLRKMVGRKGWIGVRKNSVDLCLVDGNHNRLALLDDCILCLKLMKPGGWMIFDDVENNIEKQDHVKQGLEMFLEEYGDKVKRVFKHRFVEAYEKL